MAAVVATLKDGQKAVHERGILRREGLLVVKKSGMEIEEVDDHGLHGIEQGVAMKLVVADGETATDIVEVQCAHLLLHSIEMHYGIVKEGYASARAVVALRHGEEDELRSDINHIDMKTGIFPHITHKIAKPHYQAIAGRHGVASSIEHKGGTALMTIGMAHTIVLCHVIDVRQGIVECHITYLMGVGVCLVHIAFRTLRKRVPPVDILTDMNELSNSGGMQIYTKTGKILSFAPVDIYFQTKIIGN